ncbi:hypothetical protein [Caenispirillum salinarum]|uniref:hypothetical protein n=1 Tax=Caenispirillum salinarum TaxID=859058 RepID=UPI00384A5844
MFRRAAAVVVLGLALAPAAADAAVTEYRCSFDTLPDLYIRMSEPDRVRVGLAPGIGNRGTVVRTDAALVVIENDRAGTPITFTTILRPSLRAVHSRHVVDMGSVIPAQGKGACEIVSRTRPSADAGQPATQ